MKKEKNVIVYGEVDGKRLKTITKELLGIGRKLVDTLGGKLQVVLNSYGADELSQEAISYGADTVFLVNMDIAGEYQADLHMLSILKALENGTPKIILFGNTETGQDIAPRVAFRLKTGLVTDCINLAIDSQTGQLVQTKQMYGGKVLADCVCKRFPHIVSVRPKTMQPIDKDSSRKGEIRPISIDLDQAPKKLKFIKKVIEKTSGIKLEDADVIVSGGRGIGSKEGFEQLSELAAAFKGGALGASRPPCDEGWISSRNQVGITGKIVSPRIYFAIGISGASQHVTGCSGAETIIAVNKDKNAPIFDLAQFGIVGDWNNFLPAFIHELKKMIQE